MRKWKELTKEEKKEKIIGGLLFAGGLALGIGGSYAVRKGHAAYIDKKYPKSNMKLYQSAKTGGYYIEGVFSDMADKKEYDTGWSIRPEDGSLEGLRDIMAEAVDFLDTKIASKNSDKFNEALTDAVEAMGKEK